MKLFKINFYSYWSLILIWCPFFTLIFGVFLSREISALGLLYSYMIALVVGSGSYFSAQIVESLAKKLTITKDWPGKRFDILGRIIGFLASVPFLFLAFEINFYIFKAFEIDVGRPSFMVFKRSIFISTLVFVLFILSGAWYQTRKDKWNLDAKIKESELEKERLKLMRLKDQLAPHFLFNVLNTIADLINENPKLAEKVTLDFADLLRSTIEATQKNFHSLSQEISIAVNYLKIQCTRFHPNLSYELNIAIDSASQKSILVPVLILQLLVENAIKHGFSAGVNQVRVKVGLRLMQEMLYVQVDNLGGDEVLPVNPAGSEATNYRKGLGIGLHNSLNRMKIIYNLEKFNNWKPNQDIFNLTIDDINGGTRVLLKLPILKEDQIMSKKGEGAEK